MKPGDRIGYIDTLPAKTSFKLVSVGQAPLSAFAPKMPFECTSLSSIHASNKLTLTVKIDERVWQSLNDLDSEFDKFLLENSNKLFGAAEADYLRKNPSAISLKRAKRLAPIDPMGQPLYDSRLSLRISGRTMEVESVQTAEGPRGMYISGVTWAPRTEALPASATRFSKITGHTANDFQGNSMPIVRDTLPIFALGDTQRVGSGHVRFVGPGDMATKCVIRHAIIRPAYWTNVGGGFMITLAVDHVIFENIEGEDRGASDSRSGAQELPDGFARDPHELGKALDDAHTAHAPPAKRRIAPSSILAAGGGGDTAAEESPIDGWAVRTAPASRGVTGGASESSSVGSSSFRALTRSATAAMGAYDDEEDV